MFDWYYRERCRKLSEENLKLQRDLQSASIWYEVNVRTIDTLKRKLKRANGKLKNYKIVVKELKRIQEEIDDLRLYPSSYGL